VNAKLFPYLERFKQSASGPNTIEYKIGEIFGELRHKISSGYNLREIIDGLDGLRLRSQAENHELSMLYEEKISGSPRPISEYITTEPGGINWIKISDATSLGVPPGDQGHVRIGLHPIQHGLEALPGLRKADHLHCIVQ